MHNKSFLSLDYYRRLLVVFIYSVYKLHQILSVPMPLEDVPRQGGEKQRCDTPDHLPTINITLEHPIASQHAVPNTVYG